ncbi:FAD-dependent monooxygenase [Lachnellula hyalina]|uniref:FAD-dependent monooxygenase n=1 Tax=Lachnellula hyalina TaxID=1316788 RepID=A0A8H8R1X0_9HELO|nr:FAD-dependent monooxygenase [Lachnellula hyalina]TVY26983.1 FAD-dependent monooxygenase [Lachnellula hyalina]
MSPITRVQTSFVALDVAVLGSGLGGLCAALSLRRAGHKVTLYERFDFAGEVGASLSVASNGSRWIERWGVDVPSVKPVTLQRLIMHDWETGTIKNKYDLGDYKTKFGSEYYNFHRIDMHQTLLDTVQQEGGAGIPCKIITNHRAIEVDSERGIVRFENGSSATADLIIGADGIRSNTRQQIGIIPEFKASESCCYRCIISAEKLHSLGLTEFITNNAIEFWGGYGINKIVLSACHNNEVVSCYCFYPASHNGLDKDGWNISATPQELVDTFPGLDKRIKQLFLHSEDIKMWRLYIHEEYPYWQQGIVGLLGDAAHPMLPDQSQGFCQGIEDAAALGLVFSEDHFKGDVRRALELYEEVRKPRATRVQKASAKARTDLSERIGWSTGLERKDKLTIEEHIKEAEAAKP